MLDATNLKEIIAASKGLQVLYVEDDDRLREDTTQLLSTFFSSIETAVNGQEGLEQYKAGDFDIVISDLRMPIMDGIEMVKAIKAIKAEQCVIITSAHDESHYLMELINAGIDHFLLKPLDIKSFIAVLGKAVRLLQLIKMEKEYQITLERTVAERTAQLAQALSMVEELSNDVTHRLTAAAEYRDTETGEHILRIGHYARRMAEELQLPKDFIEAIAFASPLHDVGKIGIADQILLKPGRHTAEEFSTMKQHTVIGAQLLSNSNNHKLRMAESIALNHHERWDGSGYPHGLKGDEIPLEARIIIICDQYDAMMMKRPYKPSFGHEKTYRIITEGDGRTLPQHFDPEILRLFKRISGDFLEIYNRHQDR